MNAANADRVRRYFDGEAERFDAIYRRDKSLSQKAVDRLFRGVIHHRFQLTLQLCEPLEGKRVLDVGCGSGRYAVEMARRGAEVVGVDFAPAMVQMAAEAAEAAGVGDRCRFEAVDFLTWDAPHPFDIALGIGFFDYTAAPVDFLARIRAMVGDEGQAVFSFPKRWTLRSLTRWIRLNLNGCPVYYYDRGQVAGLLGEAGWPRAHIHDLSRDYLAHGHAKGQPASQ